MEEARRRPVRFGGSMKPVVGKVLMGDARLWLKWRMRTGLGGFLGK